MGSLNNPLSTSVSSIPDLLVAILNIVIIIMTPIMAFYIIYSGFMYVMAKGEPQKIEEANKSIMYGIIGAVLIIGAKVVVAIITSTVNEF